MKLAILGKALIGAILISCPAQSDTRQADLLLTLDFSDERQIRVCISEMLQRVQQLPGASEQSQLPTLFESVANLNSEQATALNGLIAQAEQIAPAGASVHRDWLNTAFQLFSFQIDSVKVSGVIANAYIRPQWRVLPGKGSGAASCVLSFAKADFYWKLSDFSQVTSLLSEYLSANEELIKRAVSESPPASRSTWDDYNNWLNNTALHLLLERDVFPPSFKRFTKANATSQFGHEMFHCTGTPSCYYYEGDPLVGRTVSIAAISDPCWQRFVVADRSNSNDSYIFAKGRVGTGANVDDFAGPRGSEFRAHDLFYICDRGNNRIKVIRIVPTSHQPVLEWTRTGLNGPSDVDVTREGWVIVAEEDGSAIYCYCEASGCTSRRHTYMNSTLGAIDRPTSVALGRNS